METKKIDGVMHKKVLIPCPDGIKGCAVAHYRWIPIDSDVVTAEEKIKEIEKLISGMWDDETICAGEIREILEMRYIKR